MSHRNVGTWLHGVTPQKLTSFVATAVRTSKHSICYMAVAGRDDSGGNAFVPCVQEVSSSNLCPGTDYSDRSL
jgi:hypothetical protein